FALAKSLPAILSATRPALLNSKLLLGRCIHERRNMAHVRVIPGILPSTLRARFALAKSLPAILSATRPALLNSKLLLDRCIHERRNMAHVRVIPGLLPSTLRARFALAKSLPAILYDGPPALRPVGSLRSCKIAPGDFVSYSASTPQF
ncbi:MAG: hypothetical protein KJP15_05975, partial [Gammaproteobacteria bacterium]|nr:hypothetical protein [Gammaproteobacteria bacterium]